MAEYRTPDDPTAPSSSRPETCIRIFGEHVFLAHAAPSAGSLTIGRADECDIVVNERSVSRVHAILHFGETVAVEDAGSSNGTRVGAVKLGAGQRYPLLPGQVAELGVVLVTIDRADDGRNAPVLRAQLSSALARSPGAVSIGGQIVVLDEAMLGLHRLIERVAGSDISVLLTGETGAGKEVLAERIHRCSPRRDKPFLRLNCATLVEPLIESELFGHDKGAFTGAARAKQGLLEATAGGTVFLDEIGEMPLALQAKLLRVLDERQVRPVGSLKAHAFDVRFVAATNRVLEDEIVHGRFRQDLYYRLSGVTLRVPPLRQRPRELVALAEAFVSRAAGALGLAPMRLSAEAAAALVDHTWPGNVRELKNVIERAVLLAADGEIGLAELGLDHAGTNAIAPELCRSPDVVPGDSPAANADGTLHEHIGAVERQRILEVLYGCGGNRSEAARRLGISRGTLLTRLERYGAGRPRRSTTAR